MTSRTNGVGQTPGFERDSQGRIILRQRTRLSRKPDTWRYAWAPESARYLSQAPSGLSPASNPTTHAKETRVPLPPSRLLELVRNLASSDPKSRELAADQVTDWVSSYSPAEGRSLTGALVAAAVRESDMGALEAQLNAIIQLGPLAEPEIVVGLRSLNVEELPGELGDYVRDILEG